MALEKEITEVTAKAPYVAKRGVMYGVGKESAIHVGDHVGTLLSNNSALNLVTSDSPLNIAVGTAGLTAGPMMVIAGLAAAVSAALVQMDYRHKKGDIKKTYSEELAAKLHKPRDKIAENDLDTLEKGDVAKGIEPNKVIAEELQKQKRQRNWGIAFSIVATLSSIAVVMHGINPAVTNLGWLGVVLKAAAGVLTYNVVKRPLHWLGDRLFDLEKETAHDRIVALKRDREDCKPITREQVLSVFAAANPQLDRFIASEYGASFNALPLADKQQAAEDLGKLMPLTRLAEEINRGTINVTELAFTASGQLSGVAPKAPSEPVKKKPGAIVAMLGKLRHFLHPHKQPEAVAQAAVSVSPEAPAAIAVVYEEERPGRSFVKQLGLVQMDEAMTQLERLQQRQGIMIDPEKGRLSFPGG